MSLADLMSGSEVDVIIPVFNGEVFIAKAVRSVQSQTIGVSRIIVASDGSTDATMAVVEELMLSDERIVFLRLPHAGVSATRNAGIRASSSPYLAFMDADDIWLPQKLELQMRAFDMAPPEVGFVHSSYFNMDDDEAVIENARIVPPKQRGDIFLPLLLDGYVLSGSSSSVLVKREILDKAGYFDERLYHGEDWDLWMRLARISHVDFTDEAVVGIRIHDQSAQRRHRPGRALEFFRQHLIIYSKWQDILAGDKRLQAALRRMASDAVLPLLRNPMEVDQFYRSIATGDSALGQSLFTNRLHFWFEVALRVQDVLWRRIKRKVGIDE